MANLPYLSTPGSLKTVMERIRSAATPPRVTKDFVGTVIQLKGGTGATIPPFLKKIGLVASDGSPTELYKRYRNPATGGAAIAEAIKHGYKELLQANEYFYRLNDKDLLALIVQVTGAESDGQVPKLTFATLKGLKAYASFVEGSEPLPAANSEIATLPPTVAHAPPPPSIAPIRAGVGLNLAYTINLNLPATSDQAVFNAIFKSLKEHLLSEDD